MKPNNDTIGFLESLLFAYPTDGNGENPMDERTVFDFSPAFVAGVSEFIQGFRRYLDEWGIEIPESDRSFGGNVYFSLSGHGVGFWDSPETEHLQNHLEAYSGRKYRFEEIDLSDDENGKLDLSFVPDARDYYRNRLFFVES